MKTPTQFLLKCLFIGIFILSFLNVQAQQASISGEKRANHKLTLTWEGPTADESESTFKDHRVEVAFTSPTGKVFHVPGYFAADGNAGESGATHGNQWRVHFLPMETGKWEYKVDFREGPNIAFSPTPNAGSTIAFHGDMGDFQIKASDKDGLDFRGKGKLQYIGEHFLQFSNGEYFLKIGANSPEVFLEFADFDGTDSDRTYAKHQNDWKNGDLTWKNGKGKGVVGVVNYLAEQGLNTHYFLLMNAYGDGKKAIPWTGVDDYYNYDVSKLDQWQWVFDHMMKMGVMPQFVLSEQENQSYFEQKEGGDFADSRKVFYREMVARFGYLNAVTWNIGEESGWDNSDTFGKGITTRQRKDFAAYLRDLLYYDDHIVVHNGPSNTDAIFEDLLGDPSYTGLSYQGNFGNPLYGYERIAHWREASAAAGHKWVVSYDEPYTGPEFPELETWRKNAVWASFLAGGAGAEFYIGKGRDLTIQDYTLYEEYWATLRRPYQFFWDQKLPFYEMAPSSHLVDQGWCLAKAGEVYLVYLPEGGSTDLTLEEGNYSIQWFDPVKGGPLQSGSINKITGAGSQSIGNSPSNPEQDWVILVKRKE